jgi:predicted phage terminase large subunit-like protein
MLRPTPGNFPKNEALKTAHNNLLSYTALNHRNYEVAKHHYLIGQYLMAVEHGLINRLMIFMPPRAGKTMLASENFPAWFMGRNPSAEVMATTYAQDRADDIGRKVRNQMLSEIHTSVFPMASLSQDSKAVSKFSTVAGGSYYAIGRGGPATGRGAHLLLVDDIVKGQKEADSALEQKNTINWFESDIYTRLMDVNAIIIIMTRWNYNDLAGYLLDKNPSGWKVLSLPAIANSNNDPIGRKIGQALWPERYPIERLLEIKSTLSSRAWSALYQQEPIPEEGGLVDLSWFKKRYSQTELRNLFSNTKSKAKTTKRFRHITISVDTALKEQEVNDPSAFTVWGTTFENKHYLIDCFADQLGFPALEKKTRQLHKTYRGFGCPLNLLIEDKGSGTSLVQILKADPKDPIHAIAIKPEGNKVLRLSEVTHIMEALRVVFPEQAIWLSDVETQLSRFPYYSFDDIVDSISQFLKWAEKPRFFKTINKHLFAK